jgi:outer membrane protein TolC
MTFSLLFAALVAAAPAPRAAKPAKPEPAAEGPAPPEGASPELAEALQRALAAQPGGLTSTIVAEKTVAASPSVAMKEVGIERAAARVDQTIAQYLPVISGRASYTRLSKAAINFGGGAGLGALNGPQGDAQFQPVVVGPCPAPLTGNCVLDPGGSPVGVTPPFKINIPLNSYSLQAQLSVPISDYILSLAPAAKSSRAAKDAAVLFRDAERIKVETDARLAFYNWLRAVSAQIVIEDSLKRTTARLGDVQNLFQAGSATRADVLRVDSLIASQEVAINETRAFRETAARALALMMNEPPRDYQVGEDVLGAPPDPGQLPELEALIAEAHRNRLEIRGLERAIVGIDLGTRAMRANYYPRIDAFAEATYANPNQRFFPLEAKWRGSWSASVALSYTINQTIATKARVRELKADKRDLHHQLEAMRRGVAMEVTQAYLDRNRALAAIELGDKALAASAEAYRVASENYRVGNATTNDIIDAEGDQLQASLRSVNAHIDLRAAHARLMYATGRANPSRGGKD